MACLWWTWTPTQPVLAPVPPGHGPHLVGSFVYTFGSSAEAQSHGQPAAPNSSSKDRVSLEKLELALTGGKTEQRLLEQKERKRKTSRLGPPCRQEQWVGKSATSWFGRRALQREEYFPSIQSLNSVLFWFVIYNPVLAFSFFLFIIVVCGFFHKYLKSNLLVENNMVILQIIIKLCIMVLLNSA